MIDIIIPSLPTQYSRLKTVIRSIEKNTTDYRIIPIVADRSCSDNINDGLHQFTSNYVAIIDNDIEVCQGWLTHMAMVLDKYPDIGLVSGMIVDMRGRKYNEVYKNSPDNMISEVYTIGGTCMLYRGSMGVFMDNNYKGGWWNDTDFACEIAKRGYKIVVDGYVPIKHRCSFTNSIHFNNDNEAYFYSKWPDMIQEKRIVVTKSWEMK
jgi:GT2 family glycosyltransferase